MVFADLQKGTACQEVSASPLAAPGKAPLFRIAQTRRLSVVVVLEDEEFPIVLVEAAGYGGVMKIWSLGWQGKLFSLTNGRVTEQAEKSPSADQGRWIVMTAEVSERSKP